MIELIIFILPTFISIIMHDYFNKNEKTIYGIFKTFGAYCCLNNLIMMIVLFLYKSEDFIFNVQLEISGFIFKYFTLSSIIALLLPIAVEFIKKNVNLKIVFKEVKNEKED